MVDTEVEALDDSLLDQHIPCDLCARGCIHESCDCIARWRVRQRQGASRAVTLLLCDQCLSIVADKHYNPRVEILSKRGF